MTRMKYCRNMIARRVANNACDVQEMQNELLWEKEVINK